MDSILSSIPSFLHPSLRSLMISTLKLGPIPAHVAFIMDGNRRHAKKYNQPIRVAHEEGFDALKRILNFFLELKVQNVTVYAFSIENFNRDPEEVEILMDMARIRLVEICEKGALLDRHGVQIRILGRRDLLPPDVQISCAKAEALTASNTKGILNFCCPYTSQEEMATAMKRSIESAINGKIQPSKIDATTISANLYTAASPPLDILIRTSGVNRLSDFLLWQANESTVLHFISPNWPDIGLLNVLPPLLTYQAEYITGMLWKRLGRSTEVKAKSA